MTQVPPIRYSSATTTRAPYPAAIRAARTPPEPPPMTNRSPSKSAICSPGRSQFRSDFLAAFFHLGAELIVDRLGENLRPLVHIGHAELDCPRLRRKQLLAERRFVKRHQILQVLFGELIGVDLGPVFGDFLLAAGEGLHNDD